MIEEECILCITRADEQVVKTFRKRFANLKANYMITAKQQNQEGLVSKVLRTVLDQNKIVRQAFYGLIKLYGKLLSQMLC